jgi:hypothetical protein
MIKIKVNNPFRPSAYGVGYFGVGAYRANTPAYVTWRSMLMRCYDPTYKARFPSYAGCKVAGEWHDFQAFAEWFYSQAYSAAKGFSLDKDLIIPGNKTYSSKACSFVPVSINSLLLNNEASRGALPQGVSAHRKKFSARVFFNGKSIYIGTYSTPEQASIAYVDAKKSVVKTTAQKWKDWLHPEVYKNLCTWEIGQ